MKANRNFVALVLMLVVSVMPGASASAAPLTVDERVRLMKAMQECWSQQTKAEDGTKVGMAGGLDAKVDGIFKKLVSAAAKSDGKVDFQSTVRKEFAPITGSENVALVVRACYKAAFGEEFDAPKAAAPARKAKAAPTPASGKDIDQKVEATEGHVKTGAVRASQSGQPGSGNIKQTIKASDGGVVETGDIEAHVGP